MTTPVAAPPKMTAAHIEALQAYNLGPSKTLLLDEILSHVSSEVQQEGVWVPKKDWEFANEALQGIERLGKELGLPGFNPRPTYDPASRVAIDREEISKLAEYAASAAFDDSVKFQPIEAELRRWLESSR